MKFIRYRIVLISVALISGCGGSKIDSGQLDYDNGIAYKHGENNPYSGIVYFAETPTFVSNTETNLLDNSIGVPGLAAAVPNNCLVQYNKGIPDGDVACHDKDGGKALVFSIHNRLLDGESIFYTKNGNKLSDFNWSDGGLEGKQEGYSGDGKYVIHEWNVSNGRKDGKEIRRTTAGDDLAKGEWESGNFSGTILDVNNHAVLTLDNGVKNGPFKQFDPYDLSKVIVEGNYKNDLPDGTWVFHEDSNEMKRYLNAVRAGTSFVDTSNANGVWTLLEYKGIDSIEIQVNGQELTGPVKGYDKDGKVILSFNFQNGAVQAPIEKVNPETGFKATISNAASINLINSWNANPSVDNRLAWARATSAAGPTAAAALYQQQVAQDKAQAQSQAQVNAQLSAILAPPTPD